MRGHTDKKSRRSSLSRHRLLWIVLLCLAAVPFVMNLSSGDLWQDEAQTALVSQTILSHGIPMGTDGRNSFSQELGAEFDKDGIYKWHPWFPFYLVAAFFAVLGTSTLAARLPFALCGVATVIALYCLTRALWDSRRAGIAAAAALAMSVPFLILSRQCRYYAPTALFSVLALYSYMGLLERRRFAPALFAVFSVMLFHTSSAHCVALLAAVAVHCLICRRDRLVTLLIASAVIAVFTIPWLVWTSDVSRVSKVVQPSTGRGVIAVTFLSQLGKHAFPLYFLLAAVALAICKKVKHLPVLGKPSWQNLLLVALVVVSSVSLFSLTAPWPFFRYLVGIVPLCCAFLGLIADETAKLVHPGLGIAVLLLFVWCVGPIPSFAYELTHRFEGPVEGIVDYLNANGRPGDLVLITYEDLPVKFYTKMRVLGGLTGQSLAPAVNADWVILRHSLVCQRDADVAQFIGDKMPRAKYEPTVLDSLDTPFQNREEPDQHLYKTVTDGPRLAIFHKIK